MALVYGKLLETLSEASLTQMPLDDRLKPVYCIETPVHEVLLKLQDTSTKQGSPVLFSLKLDVLFGCGDKCQNCGHNWPDDRVQLTYDQLGAYLAYIHGIMVGTSVCLLCGDCCSKSCLAVSRFN